MPATEANLPNSFLHNDPVYKITVSVDIVPIM